MAAVKLEEQSSADVMRHVRIDPESDEYLTQQGIELRKQGVWRPQQAPIIRGILRGIAAAGVDLAGATSEDEIAERVRMAIKPERRTK